MTRPGAAAAVTVLPAFKFPGLRETRTHPYPCYCTVEEEGGEEGGMRHAAPFKVLGHSDARPQCDPDFHRASVVRRRENANGGGA